LNNFWKKYIKKDKYNYATGDEYEIPIEIVLTEVICLVFSSLNLFMYSKEFIERRNVIITLESDSYITSVEKIVSKGENNKTYPYYVYTNIAGMCECLIYLKYRNFSIGESVLCIYICNSRFAMNI
jgi:hypothetical protein